MNNLVVFLPFFIISYTTNKTSLSQLAIALVNREEAVADLLPPQCERFVFDGRGTIRFRPDSHMNFKILRFVWFFPVNICI